MGAKVKRKLRQSCTFHPLLRFYNWARKREPLKGGSVRTYSSLAVFISKSLWCWPVNTTASDVLKIVLISPEDYDLKCDQH